MKVAIVGSRDFGVGELDDSDVLIEDLVVQMESEDYVVSGGAKGADFWAETYARQYNVGRIIHAAAWHKYGNFAGHKRNSLIVKDADVLFAFYTDIANSKGTSNCVKQAKEKGIRVYEFDAKADRWYLTDEGTSDRLYVGPIKHISSLLESWKKDRVIESTAQKDEGG